MKRNRMLEIIIILLTEGEMKAKDLAKRFSCATKTIYRDLEYIKEAGIPIISEKGRKGGFKIEDSFIKDKSNISLKEQHKIINILKNYGSVSEEQLEKVMDTLEGFFKEDTNNWIDVDLGDPKINEVFNLLKDAIYKGETLDINDNDKLVEIKPEQILIRESGHYLKYLKMENKDMEEVKINDLEIRKDSKR